MDEQGLLLLNKRVCNGHFWGLNLSYFHSKQGKVCPGDVSSKTFADQERKSNPISFTTESNLSHKLSSYVARKSIKKRGLNFKEEAQERSKSGTKAEQSSLTFSAKN